MAEAQELCHGPISSSVLLFHELSSGKEGSPDPCQRCGSSIQAKLRHGSLPYLTGKRTIDGKAGEEATLSRVVRVIITQRSRPPEQNQLVTLKQFLTFTKVGEFVTKSEYSGISTESLIEP